jgi:hypothetical protein
MSRSTSRDSEQSRRRFLQTLGAATAAAPLAGLAWPALAQTPPPAPASPPSTPSATPTPATPATPPTPEEIANKADAQSLLDIVQRRFGSRLDKAQLDSIRDDIEGNLGAGQGLRKLELRNSDEPDIIFRAVPPEV